MYLYTVGLVLVILPGLLCFYPNRLGEFVFHKDTYTHEDITEIGILKAVAAYFEDYPRPGRPINPGDLTDMEDITAQKLFSQYYGALHFEKIQRAMQFIKPVHQSFNLKRPVMLLGDCNLTGSKLQDVITKIVDENNAVYKTIFKEAKWHFHGEIIKEAHDDMTDIREQIITLMTGEKEDFDYARELIGIYLHMLQMFYSNTNWVEMFGSDPYYDLGISGRTLIPQSVEETMPCKTCESTYPQEVSCPDNLILGDIMLTSGYMSRQDIEKPYRDPAQYTTGKCSHGGPSDETGATIAALGGINKDTAQPYLSPHYYLHPQAAQAAINHTTFFFNDKDYGLRYIIGEEKYSRFLHLKSGQSLVLTIDYSGSMRDDIVAVKEQIEKIITDRQGTINEPSDYIIVLFNDPVELTRQFQTDNSSDALEYVKSIVVDGGDDCPEYAMTGIETALGLSQPYSNMYIFTDADAKDFEKEDFVKNLAAEKNIALTFIITGNCDSRRRRDTSGQWLEGHSRSKRSVNGADLYKSLASSTGGAVYVTDKAGVSALANIIAETATTSTVTIFKREITAGEGDVNFNVDNTVAVINIVITGSSKPNEAIYNEMGNQVTAGMEITDLGNGKFIKITDPNPGEWRISGISSASWLVDVSAISTLDIRTIFVQFDPTTGFEYQIKGRPVAGEEATIIVTVPSANLLTSLDFVKLLSSEGLVLKQLENITVIEGRGDTSLYRVQFELPTQEFQVSVDGKDTDGNVFTRLQSQKITPVAMQLSLLPVNGTLFISETLTLEYIVTNKGSTQTQITVTVEDDQGFAQEPRSSVVNLDPEQNETRSFNLAAGPEAGVITTITVTARISGDTNSQFVVTRLSTKERSTKAVDEITPMCNITSMTGICDETMVDPCVCSQYNWTATAEIWDEGFGLFQISSPVKDVDRFSFETFEKGYTLENGTIMANISGSCCSPNAYITIVDVASNTGQCSFNLAPDVENILAECIQDLITPVCNITSMTGICDETMVDPCVCSQYNWTATAEIWDEGFGLKDISSSVEDAETFIHDIFAQGHTLVNGTIIANISGNCCNHTASINVTDLANNTGQCSFNLAPDVENILTECIQDLIDPVCNITSMTGICDETMVDPCVCSQYNWTATAEIWDEGFELKDISSSIEDAESFIYDMFSQGRTLVNGTIIANISGNCCNHMASINVTDLANNTGQCSFNLAPDVENILTECIQDLIDPVCNITSMTGICDETMVDPCVCSQYNWTATAEIWDEGFGLKELSSSIEDAESFNYDMFAQGHALVNGTIIANIFGNCCNHTASINVTDLANNTGQCSFKLAPDVENILTECIQDLIDPVCNITSMTGICDETMVDPCVCSQYNWTATSEIWDEGFGLQHISSSIEDAEGFTYDIFAQGHTLVNGTIIAKLSGNCCSHTASINVTDLANNTGQCSFYLAPDVENILTECIQDLIDPVCNITSMTGICDETMVDPCVCGQYNWTATSEIWDEGFGLQHISSSIDDAERFIYDMFSQGHTLVNGKIIANISGNCCGHTASINVTDLANNTGQCSFNLAPDVENILTECIQDLIDPVCNIISMTGICDKTMVDPCVCETYEWEVTTEVWDEGFGLSKIVSSVKDRARFAHDTFQQGHAIVNGTVVARVGGNCCGTNANITVYDLANNTGQCMINLAPNVDETSSECKPQGTNEQQGTLSALAAGAGAAAVVVAGIGVAIAVIVIKSMAAKKPEVLVPEKRTFSRPLKYNDYSYNNYHRY